MHARTLTCTHECVYACMHAHLHARMSACLHASTPARHVQEHTYACMRAESYRHVAVRSGDRCMCPIRRPLHVTVFLHFRLSEPSTRNAACAIPNLCPKSHCPETESRSNGRGYPEVVSRSSACRSQYRMYSHILRYTNSAQKTSARKV